MSTCLDCYGVNTIEPCAEVGCLTTNFGKCVTYSGAGLFCSAGPINTFTFTGTAVAIVSDTTVVVSSTGGTGSGATFSVTRGPASTSYSVAIVNKGGGYVVGNTLTIAGTAVGGSSPANDITISVTTLSALIDSTYTMDDAVKNLHDRICDLTPSGLLYSGFNFSCLKVSKERCAAAKDLCMDSIFADAAFASPFKWASRPASCASKKVARWPPAVFTLGFFALNLLSNSFSSSLSAKSYMLEK